MERYIKALSAARANSNFDINRFNLIQESFDEGDNPMNMIVHSSNITFSITYHDVFNYYRFKNKEFDIIVSGGIVNGKLRQSSKEKSTKSSRQSKKTRTRNTRKEFPTE